MLTVYFDTSFYVDLARASDDEASTLIESLNELKVQGVFSFDLIREMLPHTTNPGGDADLVGRLRKLEEGFLYLDEGTWNWLLVQGDARETLRKNVIARRKGMDLAESQSVSASKPMTDEEAERMMEENRVQFAEIGLLDEDGNLDPKRLPTTLRNGIKSLAMPGWM